MCRSVKNLIGKYERQNDYIGLNYSQNYYKTWKMIQEFWKKIGRIGISNCQNKSIPMEVVSENGEIVNDVNLVLDRWGLILAVCLTDHVAKALTIDPIVKLVKALILLILE